MATLAKVIGHEDWLENPDFNTPDALARDWNERDAGPTIGVALAGKRRIVQYAAPPRPDAEAHHWDPAQMRAHIADHLRAVLQLQPSQDAALNAFLDALKPPAGDHDRYVVTAVGGVSAAARQLLDAASPSCPSPSASSGSSAS